MKEFHTSDLNMGARFRDSIRGGVLSTEHLDRGQRILNAALEKHGEPVLTKKNFHEVMTHVHRDPHWKNMYSAGPEFENALRKHLEIPEENHASITPEPSPSSKISSEESISAKKEDGSEA
jgi:hypothetical protein